MLDAFQVSERRACQVAKVYRSLFRYQSQADNQAFLRKRIREIAATRVRYGYKRIHVLLRREGWPINAKRVYRLYCEEGLHLRNKRPRRHVSAAHRQERPQASRPNESWSMDFVSDALFDGRRLRALTVIDNFTSFNGRFHDECLNVNWFLSLEDAKTKIEAWRRDYNGSRPHTSLGDRTPREFARCHRSKAQSEDVQKSQILTSWPDLIRGDLQCHLHLARECFRRTSGTQRALRRREP